MKNYELLYILPASKTSEETVKDFQDVQKHIEKFGGAMLETLLEHPFLAKTGIGKEEEPEELKTIPVTKRKLAYPIKHEKFGFYCLVNFQAEAGKIEELDEYLRLNNNVLRHIILQADPMTREELELLQTLFARKKAEQDKEEAEQRETAAAKEEARKASRRESIEAKPTEKAEEVESESSVSVEEPEKEEAAVEIAEVEEEKKDEEKKAEKEPAKEEVKEKKAAENKKAEEESKEEKKSSRKSKIKLEELEDKLDEILENTIV